VFDRQTPVTLDAQRPPASWRPGGSWAAWVGELEEKYPRGGIRSSSGSSGGGSGSSGGTSSSTSGGGGSGGDEGGGGSRSSSSR
jgi:hypothetical protein